MSLVRRALAAEAAVWRNLYRWARREPLRVVVGSHTSVDVRLREPVAIDLPRGRSAPVRDIRIYADDPDGLVAGMKASAHAQEG